MGNKVTKTITADYTVMSTDFCSKNRAVIFLRRHTNCGSLCVAFAGGLIVATCFPNALVIIIIAGLLVFAGISLCRY